LPLRVYVAPCGIGLGHITRCEPIADALVSRGAEVVYSTYSDGLDYARRRGLPTLPTVSIGFRVKEDGTIDFKTTAATSGFSLGVRRFLEQLTAEIRNIKRFKPDVVLSDSRVSSLVAGKLMGVPVALILNQFRVEIVKKPSAKKVTPVERLFFLIANIFWLFFRTLLGGVWARSNLMLIPDFPAPYTISASNLAIPKRYKYKVKLIGPIVSDEPKKRSTEAALNRSLFFASRKPLIYAAVSGPKTERTVLADLLLESLKRFPSEYEVVVSRGEPNGSSAPVRDRNLTVYDWIEDQNEVLEASNVVVSRAGHGTIMKSIMLGKPMILIPIPDHTEQYGNAKRASKLGLAEIIPQREVTTERLIDATRRLLDSPPDALRKLTKQTPLSEGIAIGVSEIQGLAHNKPDT
jgi:UDP-N-acetylglucosamine--N-acetylmuramyl-(pentapeptide) pyrophosphoryl-undecaprenol N-acetylglucosamine transferase